MPLLSERDSALLREKFANELVNPVAIELFTKPDPRLYVPGRQPTTSRQTRELLEELVELSELLTLTTHDQAEEPELVEAAGIEHFPAFVLTGQANRPVRFLGMPAGYEFASLIQDVVSVSTEKATLQESTLAALDQVTEDVHIQVFVTPT